MIAVLLPNQKNLSAVHAQREAWGSVQDYAQTFLVSVVKLLIQVADHTGLKSMLHIASVMFSAQ